MRENIIEQLRFCATRFSCEGCCRYPYYGCDENALVWLKQEVRDG